MVTIDKVVHFEIPSRDTKKSKEFYSKAFGWTFFDSPETNYTLANTVESDERGMPKTAGAINGGLIPKKSDEKTMIVIKVHLMEEALQKVQKAGGKVVLEIQHMGGIGLYARIEDVDGNVVGLWQDTH